MAERYRDGSAPPEATPAADSYQPRAFVIGDAGNIDSIESADYQPAAKGYRLNSDGTITAQFVRSSVLEVIEPDPVDPQGEGTVRGSLSYTDAAVGGPYGTAGPRVHIKTRGHLVLEAGGEFDPEEPIPDQRTEVWGRLAVRVSPFGRYGTGATGRVHATDFVISPMGNPDDEYRVSVLEVPRLIAHVDAGRDGSAGWGMPVTGGWQVWPYSWFTAHFPDVPGFDREAKIIAAMEYQPNGAAAAAVTLRVVQSTVIAAFKGDLGTVGREVLIEGDWESAEALMYEVPNPVDTRLGYLEALGDVLGGTGPSYRFHSASIYGRYVNSPTPAPF